MLVIVPAIVLTIVPSLQAQLEAVSPGLTTDSNSLISRTNPPTGTAADCTPLFVPDFPLFLLLLLYLANFWCQELPTEC